MLTCQYILLLVFAIQFAIPLDHVAILGGFAIQVKLVMPMLAAQFLQALLRREGQTNELDKAERRQRRCLNRCFSFGRNECTTKSSHKLGNTLLGMGPLTASMLPGNLKAEAETW